YYQVLHQGVSGRYNDYRQRDHSLEGTSGGSLFRSAVEIVPHVQREWRVGDSMHFDLKPISADSIPEALAKVERYRLLNEPSLAESICLDILTIAPEHQQALISLLLARTDQFTSRLTA